MYFLEIARTDAHRDCRPSCVFNCYVFEFVQLFLYPLYLLFSLLKVHYTFIGNKLNVD